MPLDLVVDPLRVLVDVVQDFLTQLLLALVEKTEHQYPKTVGFEFAAIKKIFGHSIGTMFKLK